MSLQEIDINQSAIETLDENSLNELIINSVNDTNITPISDIGDKGVSSTEDSLTAKPLIMLKQLVIQITQ